MTTQVQFRKDTTPEHALFTGLSLKLPLILIKERRLYMMEVMEDLNSEARWEVVNANGNLSCGLDI